MDAPWSRRRRTINAPKPKTTMMGTPLTREAGEAYRRAIADVEIWMTAYQVFDELIRTRAGKQALALYVETRGDTDWVWLEETASSLAARRPASLRGRIVYELEASMRHLAIVTLVLAQLRALHPDIDPPTWWHEEMAAVRGVPFVRKDEAEVIRDAFLGGRDQEAIAMLSEQIIAELEDDDELEDEDEGDD